MIDNSEIETYIYLSRKLFSIAVLKADGSKKIFYDDFFVKNSHNKINVVDLEKFLEKNILKIEKQIESFINQIYLILDNDLFLSIDVSIKEKNFKKSISKKDIVYMLNNIKGEILKNNPETSIIHLTINNFLYDNKNSSILEEDLICDDFGLEVNFVCFKDKFLNKFNESFKKYQITIDQVMSGNYVKKFISTYDGLEICLIAQKLRSGLNSNEVQIAPKKLEKKGFFEKFFNFFN